MEPKNVFVKVPKQEFLITEASFTQTSAICAGEDPQYSGSARQVLSVLKMQAKLTIGLAYPSLPPKGDRFIWILTRTFSLTSDKVLILKKQPK